MKNILINDIKEMSFRQHLYYWLIPFTILAVFIVFYFSGVPQLVNFICPPTNWEWGILENIQLTIIVFIFGFSIFGVIKNNDLIIKSIFICIAILSIFIFLEEIDYGAHFVQLFKGEKNSFIKDLTGSFNIHNRYDNAKYYKRSVYGIMLFIFVIAPFLANSFKNQRILFLIPQPKILIVAALCIIIDLLPRIIVKFNILQDGGLGVNIGEFSEITVYYIFLIYIYQLVFKNKLYSTAAQKL